MDQKANNAPEGTRQGAWEVESGLVRFALWAPGKESVAVVGDFNDWDTESDPMHGTDNGICWCEVKMEEGEHEYMFVIDGDNYIGDPYAREVNWRAEGAHGLIRTGDEPFQWSDGDFQMPDTETRIIYEAHVGDFTADGTFRAMADQLDYLKDLGINVLELMPIFEFSGDFSWGYNPAYTMAPERSYGTLNDFKYLINEAHARGIAVFLDIVFNHVDYEHPFTQLYGSGENPFFNDKENPWGFPNLDQGSDAVKDYIHQIQNYWLNDCHIDGFRYDATGNIGYDGINGVSFISYDARKIQSHVHLIAEQVPEDPEMIRRTAVNAAWHKSWHHIMVAQLMERDNMGYSFGDMDQIRQVLNPASNGYRSHLEVINYTESHDWERIVYDALQNENTSGSALKRSVLGAAVLFTAPGIPMILYGQEVATAIPKESTMEVGHRPEWGEAFKDDGVKWLFECYKRLIWLRREEKALRTGKMDVWLANAESKVLFYRRFIDGEDDEVVVMLNFSSVEQFFEIQLPRGGEYHEILTNEDWVLGEGDYKSSIPGSTARVLKRIGG